MKLLKTVTSTILILTSFSLSAQCIDSMDSYIKFSIAGGCNIVNAAAKNKDTKEEHTLYMMGLNEHCDVFSNGVAKKELNEKFPVLTAQSPDTCTVKAQHAAITEIRKAYNIK